MQNSVVMFTFSIRSEKPFLGKSGTNNQNCQFKWKFGTNTNLNMQNSVMMSTLFVFDHKYPSNIPPKNQNCQLKLKIGI